MWSFVPNLIKENSKMKRKLFITAILFAAFVHPVHKAYMSNREFGIKREIPVPPIYGRKKESKCYKYLSKPLRTYNYWMRKGKSYLTRKEFEQAILAFRKASKLRPTSEETRFLLAHSYEKRSMEGLPGDTTNWEQLAIDEYQAAIILADHLPSRYNLALLYQRLDEHTKARKELEHILTISPSSSLGRKAQTALARVFAQDYTPTHLSVNYPQN
jgi:tetratricopeptide (TPR) repeat protein